MAHQLLTGRFPFDDKRNPGKPSISKIWWACLLHIARLMVTYLKDFAEPLACPDVISTQTSSSRHWVTHSGVKRPDVACEQV